jgi:hypothetical protein
MLNFKAPSGGYALTFEDNGKVAYAYLKSNGCIVGEVWLYNRCAAPETSEWLDPNNIPFANCRGFVMDGGQMQRKVGKRDVLVDWEEENGTPVAYIYIFGDLYGVVGVNDKPGYARFASRDSRLAQVLELEE